ncbi:NTF2-like N-terminal transpeptidase domain-containing protein [Williamsia sterculiae]|uniref:NTF2-like N-terminal transpeptidase domain-containing protein n=1 Tax=Williamsia sterculiae TaxID=1344003 RepID=A0A1N7CCV1_9NOCA|nr:NTF2-like N-terminal transpeptidase domain-containing protein [Williamsia sterculiae]SIR61244.1 NTF2-like N-terminal transpeptidase domain-containing protein [Williamsia sterculiae]
MKSGVWARLTVTRWMLIVVVALTAATSVAACGILGSNKESELSAALHRFADAIGAQDATKAGSLTSAPAQATDAYTSTLTSMRAQKVQVTVQDPVEYSDGSANFSLTTSWQFGKDRTFTIGTKGSARKLSAGWRVQWDPSLIADGLPPGGYLRQVRTDARPAPALLSSTRQPWMSLQPVNDIVVDPARVKNPAATASALAATLKPIAPLITTSTIRSQLDMAQGKPVTVVSLRDSDMTVLDSDPDDVTGVSVVKNSDLLVIDRRINTPLTATATDYWQTVRDATSGWEVQRVDPGRRPIRLDGAQGPAAKSLSTSFDPNAQLTLGDSVVEVAQAASMLVLDAKTGGVVAAAQNTAAQNEKVTITDRYTPGTTLDPVFAAVNAAAGGNKDKTRQLANGLGLELGYMVPGLTPKGGQGAAPASQVSLDSASSRVSMLEMGAFGAAVARGDAVAPTFFGTAPTVVSGGKVGAADPSVLNPVRAAMAKTVATGDASDLTGAPGLNALVGTNGPQGPGWFVGLQGGKVVVVYCTGAKSGTAALQVAQKYFRTM